MNVDYIISNCQVVKPANTFHAAVAIKNGKIVLIGDQALMAESGITAKNVIDAEGKYLLPGCIDPHMHVDWPDWETVSATRSSTKAAVAGGYTTVINFLNGTDTLEENFLSSKDCFEKNSYTDMAFHMAIFTDEQIKEIPRMAELGVSSFKFFLPYRGSEVVAPLKGIDDGTIYMGLKEIAKLNAPARALIHCENVELVFKLKEKYMGNEPEGLTWDDVRPPVCEIDGVRRILTFSEDTGCPVYVVHTSTEEAVKDMQQAKGNGIDVRTETCVQYLTLMATDYDRTLGKVNPPLRMDKRHLNALWDGINNGSVDTIGSDHAPCARKHKPDFWSAIVGMAGIQTLLPVLLSEGVNKGRITINKVAEICSYNVAKTFGLTPQKGLLEIGSDADLILVDLNKTVTVKAEDLYHISDFSCFEGWELTGSVDMTMIRGEIVMQNGKAMVEPGYARFLPRVAAPKE
ncbi:amidohydrolase family protein [bacterium]|nr:amidohydrolase family protein [bacterium]